ncbi:MAG: hypothetical protein KGH72_04720 [Candidatus Micrarchaeota archaeon]|nr:hypothetical protein [Candidatus Micrarchaeota archaeon]
MPENGRGKGLNLQAAIEYLTTYSVAVLLLVILLAIIAALALAGHSNGLSTQSASTCYITAQLPCSQFVVADTQNGSEALMFFVNNLGQNLSMPANSFVVKPAITNATYVGNCYPANAMPGTPVTCVASSPYKPTVGSQLNLAFQLAYNNLHITGTSTAYAAPKADAYGVLLTSNVRGGGVSVNNVRYASGSTVIFVSGINYRISADAPSGYAFQDWIPGGSVSIPASGINSTQTTANATANGTIEAVYVASTTTSSSSTSSTSTIAPICYVPITISNNQAAPISGPFQMLINVTSSTYSSCINSQWTNVEFSTGPNGAGRILKAWVESNATNTGLTGVWVNVTASLGASGSGSNITTIYMDMMPYIVMTGSNPPTGEAPQLSPLYGEYDNGPSVFLKYWNFSGPSLPAGWASSDPGGMALSSGLTISAGSVYTTSTVFNSINTIVESDVAVTSSTPQYLSGLIQSSGNSPMYNNPTNLSEILYKVDFDGSTYPEYEAFANDGAKGACSGGECYDLQGAVSNVNLFTAALNTYYVLSSYVSPTSVGELENYHVVGSASGTFATNQYIILGYYKGAGAGSNAGPTESFQWVRTRAYLPNGIMPQYSFGAMVT